MSFGVFMPVVEIPNLEAELARLSRNLTDYWQIRMEKMTLPQVVDKVGNDVRIQLFKLFWSYRFKGKGIAFRELKRRTRVGVGTHVRSKVLTQFAPTTDKRGRRLTSWQRLVYQETSRRQAGAGILAVALLDRRWRSRKNADGTVQRYLVENKSGQLGTLARIENKGDSYTIEGFAPGHADVAQRYGILEDAVRRGSVNLEQYINRKLEEAMGEVFKRN